MGIRERKQAVHDVLAAYAASDAAALRALLTDIVMANATMTALLISGNPYSNDYCYVFRFEGDRIAEGTEYADTAYAIQLASAPTAT